MYLRLENWSIPFLISQLKAKDLPHKEHILKVYASDTDPRSSEMYNRKSITVFEINDGSFKEDEIFTYDGRENYTSLQLNERLLEFGLSDAAIRRVRALFRFANSHETGLTQQAMQLQDNEGSWLIDHPFGDIDGINKAIKLPEKYGEAVHLDIFVPDSLEKIAELLGVPNLDDAEGIISYSEIKAYQHRSKEGFSRRGKEG